MTPGELPPCTPLVAGVLAAGNLGLDLGSWTWVLDWIWHAAAVLGGLWALFSVPSVLLSRRGTPLSALSWLVALFALPGLGALLWWIIGRKGLRRGRKKRRRARAAEFARRRLESHPPPGLPPGPEGMDLQQSLSLDSLYQVVTHRRPDQLTLLLEPHSAFEYMEAELQRAERCIHLLYYIWRNDATGRRWAKILCERARAGVKVRVLLDHLGSLDAGPDLWAELKAAGGEVAYFMPLRLLSLKRPNVNFRNHRKIAVIDHRVAFTGGMNVCEEHRRQWVDTHFCVRGPSVAALEDVMLDDWYFTTGQYVTPEIQPEIGPEIRPEIGPEILPKTLPETNEPGTPDLRVPGNTPSAPSPPAKKTQEKVIEVQSQRATVLASGPDSPQPWIHDEQFRLMAAATHRLWIATPYFIPSESISTALRTAAARGLDVRILVPAQNDHAFVRWASRAYYPDLLAAGIKIYEYLPRMMHAKMMICDEDRAIVGSSNLDPRSYRLNFEVACVFESAAMVTHLERWYLEHFADSHRIRKKDLAEIPKWQQLRDSVAHLLSPML